MPLFALIARIGPDGIERRTQHRPAHLAAMRLLDRAGRVRHGGPLKNDHGDIVGSLIVFEAENLEAARGVVAADPYTVAGVFESYELLETQPVFPETH